MWTAQGVMTMNAGADGSNQSVTGLPGTPVCVFFQCANSTATGFSADAWWSLGWAVDSTHRYQTSQYSKDGVVGGTTCYRHLDNNMVVFLDDGVTHLFELDYVSADANGFTVKRVVNQVNTRVHWFAIGGSEMSAFAGDFVGQGTTGNQAITGTTFQPAIAFILGAFRGTFSSTSDMSVSVGAFTDASHQWCDAFCAPDSTPTGPAKRVQRTDSCIIDFRPSDQTVQARAHSVSMDATPGFTINWDVAGTGQYAYLVLKGGQWALGASNKPTGAAPVNQDVTVGFQPLGLWLATHGLASGTAVQADARISSGQSDGTNVGSLWIEQQDAQTNSEADKAESATKALTLATAPSTLDAECDADLVAVTNGFRLHWTTNNAVASEILWAVVGNAPAVLPPADDRPYQSTFLRVPLRDKLLTGPKVDEVWAHPQPLPKLDSPFQSRLLRDPRPLARALNLRLDDNFAHAVPAAISFGDALPTLAPVRVPPFRRATGDDGMASLGQILADDTVQPVVRFFPLRPPLRFDEPLASAAPGPPGIGDSPFASRWLRGMVIPPQLYDSGAVVPSVTFGDDVLPTQIAVFGAPWPGTIGDAWMALPAVTIVPVERPFPPSRLWQATILRAPPPDDAVRVQPPIIQALDAPLLKVVWVPRAIPLRIFDDALPQAPPMMADVGWQPLPLIFVRLPIDQHFDDTVGLAPAAAPGIGDSPLLMPPSRVLVIPVQLGVDLSAVLPPALVVGDDAVPVRRAAPFAAIRMIWLADTWAAPPAVAPMRAEGPFPLVRAYRPAILIPRPLDQPLLIVTPPLRPPDDPKVWRALRSTLLQQRYFDDSVRLFLGAVAGREPFVVQLLDGSLLVYDQSGAYIVVVL